MRVTGAYGHMNMAVMAYKDRPDVDVWKNDTRYKLIDVFTTLDGSWEPSNSVYSVPTWAREAYLKPVGDPEYFDDAGGDRHLFALCLDKDGNKQPLKGIMYWSDGIEILNALSHGQDNRYLLERTKSTSKWANIQMSGADASAAELEEIATTRIILAAERGNGSSFAPDRGEHGPWCWTPIGWSDVLIGGGLPDSAHVSTFAVWQEVSDDEPVDDPTEKPGCVGGIAMWIIGILKKIAGIE